MDFSRDQHMLLQAAITLLLVTSHITAAPTETVFTTTEPEALTLDDGDNNVFAEVRQASIGSVFEEYQRLTRLTSEFRNANKDVFGNFKQLRLNGDDIDSDLHAFTFEGLPNPVSRFQSRFLQERDLIVLHRDNLLQFQSFIDAMYMDELDVFYDEEGETPFHEEFQSLALQIRKIVTKCNSLLHQMNFVDAIVTTPTVNDGMEMLNSVFMRELRHAKVLKQLLDYLPGAKQDFERWAYTHKES